MNKYLNIIISGTKTMFIELFNKQTTKSQWANIMTFFRIIIPTITLLITIFIYKNNSNYLFVCSILTIIGAITDFFDGKLARKYNSISEYGILLDQIADKWFTVLTVISLCFINYMYLILLFGEFIIFSINIYYKLKYENLNIVSSKLGKLKEWPLFLSLGLGFLNFKNITNILISTTILLQLITSFNYLLSNQKLVQKIKHIN